MSTTTTNHMTAPHGDSANWPADLIDNKFDELARKILGELKQASHSRDFFQAVDVILTEQPAPRRQDARRPPPGHTTGPSQQQRSKQSRRPAGQETDRMQNGHDNDMLAAASLELKRQCELIMERQRQQQEQLDNHQQILFDSQYRSLPAEITDAAAGHEPRRANARASPTKSGVPTAASKAAGAGSALPRDSSDSNLLAAAKAAGGKQSAPVQSRLQPSGKLNGAKATLTRSKENLAPAGKSAAARPDQRLRSAIPQSTITSGIGQRAESSLYPIAKSATVGGSSVASAGPNPGPALGNGLVRQASLRLNKQTREAQQEFIKQQTRPLAASEKLRHRRPTKASILDQRQPPSDESDFNDEDDDEEDEDDDDDEYQYQNLVHRRAFLDQRFINQQEPAARQAGGGELVAAPAAQASSNRHQVTSTIQSGVRQASANAARQQQKQSLSSEPQVARAGTQMSKPAIVGTTRHAGDEERQQHEPRSLGGLLTSHDLSQLYKPHMNYSTSLLGNHRLSDDDEIIIIPTAQSPSLMSASVSPVGGVGGQLQQAPPADDQHPDRTTGNMDELSERFSISRTKSFWEKLANSKSSGDESSKCNTSPQQDKQYFNSSQRSLSSGPNLVADAKGSQGSLMNQAGAGQAANGHHYPAAMKSAFDRMDSTGGSGNSHYSGGSSSSSTSGDEPTLAAAGAGHLSLAERRSMLAAAAAGATGKRAAPAAATASINPTINQLVQQEQINRSDRFRRTR